MPSDVGTSTAALATSYPFQRKGFYHNGRYWVFYYDGTNMVYRTSTDGIAWTAATSIIVLVDGYEFSIWFDGTWVHCAFLDIADSDIHYRSGTPEADGTITWNAATDSLGMSGCDYPMITVDSAGYAWIGYMRYSQPYVTKSGNNNGTWGATPVGFPHQLSAAPHSDWGVIVVALTTGRVLVLYAFTGGTIKAQKWDGAAWDSEVATTSIIRSFSLLSAVSQGDDVDLVFLQQVGAAGDIIHTRYTYATNSFGAETSIETPTITSLSPVISINPATNDLYVFWINYPTLKHIYARKYTRATSTWEVRKDWITEAQTIFFTISCYYQPYGNYIGLHWTIAVPAFTVRFDYLTGPDYGFPTAGIAPIGSNTAAARLVNII